MEQIDLFGQTIFSYVYHILCVYTLKCVREHANINDTHSYYFVFGFFSNSVFGLLCVESKRTKSTYSQRNFFLFIISLLTNWQHFCNNFELFGSVCFFPASSFSSTDIMNGYKYRLRVCSMYTSYFVGLYKCCVFYNFIERTAIYAMLFIKGEYFRQNSCTNLCSSMFSCYSA